MEGPTMPAGLPDWPKIKIDGAGLTGPKLTLTVRNAAGAFADAGVTLYKSSSSVAIDQGRTNQEGRLTIYGVGVGDVLYASSINGALAGNLTITATQNITLTLASVHKTFATLAAWLGPAVIQQAPTPYLRIIPESAHEAENHLLLSYEMQNFDPPSETQSALTIIITEPGQETARFAQAAYRNDAHRYTGQLRFAAAPGMNNVQVIGAVANDIYYLHASYQVQRVDNYAPAIVFSGDGRVRLDLNTDSFPGRSTYVAITSQNAVPGPISPTHTLIGSIYDITASGSVTTLSKGAALTIEYDPTMLPPNMPPDALGLYWWNAGAHSWDPAPALSPEPERHALSAQILALGAYAIMVKQ